MRAKTVAVGAEQWADDAPELVRALADAWDLTVVGALVGGTESIVLDVRRSDGRPAALKLVIPRAGDAARHEITVLRLIDGDGGPALFEADPDRGAILMERLGRSLSELGLPMERRHKILCDVAARLWRPAAGCGLPTGADKGRWLIGAIADLWDQLDRPITERAVDHAVACAQRRVDAHDDERAVLVHGDVHQWNALESSTGFALVDPDGLLAEPEYDLGIVMREDPAELLVEGAWHRAHRLAERTGLDPVATWEWGVVERVSTGLVCTQLGLQPFGEQMLAAAEAIAAGTLDR